MQAVEGEAQAARVAEAYADLVRGLAAERPEIIVLPEKAFALRRDSAAAAPLIRAAEQVDAVIVAGFDETLPDGRRVNTARIFMPRGPSLVYFKRKLVPGIRQAFAAGAVPLAFGDRGVAICKDMDFAAMIRSNGSVRLMLAPAWDFGADGRLHARMAVVRGVENGFALARAAAQGRLTVSDAYGRIIAERATSAERPVTLAADVGLGSGETLYRRAGDAFGWIIVVGAAGLLIASRRKRKSAAGSLEVKAKSLAPFAPARSSIARPSVRLTRCVRRAP